MPTIPRKLPNASLEDWNKNKPTKHVAREHMERVIRCAPAAWQSAVRERLDAEAPPILARNLSDREWLQQPPEWAQAWDLMQAVADYEDEFGQASLWNLDDYEICAMAKKLAGEADELDALAIGQGATLEARVDSIRLLVRCVGVAEDKPITGEPAIKRAQDAAWWRRRLRVHVARVVEAGAVGGAYRVEVGYGATLTSLSDLIQWAQACERSVQQVGDIVMSQALAKELGCDAGSHWLCIQSLRFDATRGKLPVSWTYAYIDAQYASVLKAIEANPSALMSELLEKEFGLDLATVEQDVTGCKLDALLAKNLNANKDEAALQVVRRYLTRDNKPALVTVSIHPAKRFSIRTTLTRN